ncbi:MAG: hypothetical protein HW421_1634 [Ignavibacteria bacterium]|nr:hypothetical protein [Ignavibacteria bacterium]
MAENMENQKRIPDNARTVLIKISNDNFNEFEALSKIENLANQYLNAKFYVSANKEISSKLFGIAAIEAFIEENSDEEFNLETLSDAVIDLYSYEIDSDKIGNSPEVEEASFINRQTVQPQKEEEVDINQFRHQGVVAGGFSSQPASGKLPEPLPSPLLLNVGCGADVRDGFLNIDLYSSNPKVIGMDVRHLGLPDNCADGILASDILEHFSHRETGQVLREWNRVLKPGGEILIRCPSLKLQTEAYMSGVWDADVASYMIFGGQTNPGDYHCIGFDRVSIEKHLKEAGFTVEHFEEQNIPQTNGFINLNMIVRGRKSKILANYESTPIQFNAQSVIKTNFKTGINQLQLNIVWEGSQFVYHSLALINREHSYNLLKTGQVNLTIIPYENDQFLPDENSKYKALMENDIRNKPEVPDEIGKLPYLWIRHQWPPNPEPPKGAKWIIMQPWEFSQLRKDFVEIFKQADEIWTPSNFSRNSFVNSGLDFNKVQVIPNGVAPELFSPSGSKYHLATNKSLKILFVGGTIFRKGIDLLLQAYTTAFNSEDDICLIIKDMGGDSFYKGQTAKSNIESIKRDARSPEIIYIEEYFNEEEMAELYRACDVFVCPYRGEGFSLPTIEAMACGLPVIVTEGGATDDFVDEEVGWLLPSSHISVGNMIDGKPLTGETFLLEPDKNYLIELFKELYNNPSEIFLKGTAASLRARTEWTWNRASLKMLSRLDYLSGTTLAIEAQTLLSDEEDANIIFCKAEKLFFTDESNEANKLYKKALSLNHLAEDYAATAFNRLAAISLKKNKLDEAGSYLMNSNDIIENNPDAKLISAEIFLKRAEIAEAFDIYSDIMKNWQSMKFKSNSGITLEEIFCIVGDIMLDNEDIEGAHSLYTCALKQNNNCARACYGAGLCFLVSGLEEDASQMFDWAIKLNPEYEPLVKAKLESIDKNI